MRDRFRDVLYGSPPWEGAKVAVEGGELWQRRRPNKEPKVLGVIRLVTKQPQISRHLTATPSFNIRLNVVCNNFSAMEE